MASATEPYAVCWDVVFGLLSGAVEAFRIAARAPGVFVAVVFAFAAPRTVEIVVL